MNKEKEKTPAAIQSSEKDDPGRTTKLPRYQPERNDHTSHLDVVVVAAGGSRSDVGGNVRRGSIGVALSVDVGRSIVDSHGDVSRGIDGLRVVDDVGFDDGVGGNNGGDVSSGGLDDGAGRDDLDTLGVGGQLVEVTAGLCSSTFESVGVGGSILGCGLA